MPASTYVQAAVTYTRKLRGNAEFGFLSRNILSLYSLYLCSYVVSFVTIPYLTRTLGVDAFGRLAASQAFSWCLQMIVEYGFNYSGTRAAQQVRDNRDALARLVADVNSAKLLLFGLTLVATLLLRPLLPSFLTSTTYFQWALLFGFAQGLSPMWVFQGTDQLKRFTVLDLSSRIAGALVLFVIVKSPADGETAMALQALAALVSTVIGFILIHRMIPVGSPSVSGGWRVLMEGRSLFAYRLTSNLQMYANPLLLSFFTSADKVGLYSAAERIVKFLMMTLSPLGEAVYPFLSRAFDRSREQASSLARRMMLLTATWTLIMGLVIFVFAPLIVSAAFGPSFAEAVPVMRLLALLPLLFGCIQTLGLHWMIPAGMSSAYTATVTAGFVFHVLLSAALSHAFEQRGMAGAVLLSQSITLAALFLALRKISRTREYLETAPCQIS